jgi:hypothetical protein
MIFFTARPAMAAVLVLEKQKALLVYEIVATAAKLGVLLLGLVYYESAMMAIAGYSLTAALLGLLLIAFVYHSAWRADQLLAVKET